MLVLNLESEIQLLDDGPRGSGGTGSRSGFGRNWHLLITNGVGESLLCPPGRRRVRLC
jgi:hypothetical protein